MFSEYSLKLIKLLGKRKNNNLLMQEKIVEYVISALFQAVFCRILI